VSDGGQQGKLYTRLHELQYVEDSSIVNSYEMEKLFDEARASFPNPRFSDRNCVEREKAVLDWFNKWFGDTK
jgi:hypothetical protein